jgi:alpha-beta hydrolase superfamily lysophospholipase
LRTLVPLVASVHPGKPIFLLGESMGGAVVLATMGAPKPPAVAGVILSAPAVWGRVTMNPLYRIALWLVPRIAPGEQLTGQGLKIQASDNIPMLIALGRDPLVIKGTRADSVSGLADLMDEGLAAAPRLRVPSLVLYGEKDEVVPKAPVERMVETLGGPHRVAVYSNGWHLLLRDLDREVVWQDILVWMMDRHAPLPSESEKQPGSLFASNKNKSNFN